MITVRRWLIIFRRLGVDGYIFPGFWGGRGQTPGLLFGSDTWVVTPRIGRTLGGFHHRMALRLAVMQPKQNMEGR